MLRASRSSLAPPYELEELWVQNGAEAILSESAYYGAKQEGGSGRVMDSLLSFSLVLRRRREEGGGSEQFVL